MTEGEVFQALRDAMWAAVLIAAPILVVALLVGLVIGLLQALTSVQEATLTFVPKLAAVIAVFLLTIGYMARICIDLFRNTVLPHISG
jgi:flagellar biosynthetic protein FliQ